MEIEQIYYCQKCRKEVFEEDGDINFNFLKPEHIGCGGEVEKVCAECLGTGEISTDEDDGEGHIARGVGSQKCRCRIKEIEYDNQ